MLFCGIDFGTTNTKAVLVDAEMSLLGRVSFEVPAAGPGHPFSAQTWLDHFYKVFDYFKSIDAIRGEKVACSLTAQGGSFVFLDSKFIPISPARSWLELSSEKTAKDLESVFGKAEYYQKTGWEPKAWLMACKIKEGPAKEARFAATVPDFIHARTFGRLVGDITNAEITGLYDFGRKCWDQEILEWAGIREEQLAEICSEVKVLAEDIAIAGTRVTMVTSSHDQYAAMRGCGLDEHSLMLATGSAWVINGKSRKPIFDPDQFLFHPGRDLLPGYFGFIHSFGPVGKEYEQVLQRKESMPDFMALTGKRVGAVLEKMGNRKKVTKLWMTGGALRSSEWPGIIATTCGLKVEAVRFDELTAFGAAMFARSVGIGEDTLGGWPKGVEICAYEPECR
jgi:sugar (pentulose or hexulose) kinase